MLWEVIRTCSQNYTPGPPWVTSHGHDRNVVMCVNDPTRWQSTPVLQSPPWPDEDLSPLPPGCCKYTSVLLVQTLAPKHVTTTPPSNVELATTGVLQVYKCTSSPDSDRGDRAREDASGAPLFNHFQLAPGPWCFLSKKKIIDFNKTRLNAYFSCDGRWILSPDRDCHD